MGSYIISAAVIMVTGIVLGYLNKAVNKDIPRNGEGRYYLAMHISYKYLGYGCIFLGLAISSVVFFIELSEVFAVVSILALFVFFTIAGIMSILYFKRHTVSFDEKNIEVTSIQNTAERFDWENIKSGKLNKVSGAIVFQTKDGSRFRVHHHLNGINLFFDMLKQKTGLIIDLSYN